MGPEHRSIHIHCPGCGSHSITKSRKRGVGERALSVVTFRRPYRCATCDLRFWAPAGELKARHAADEKHVRHVD